MDKSQPGLAVRPGMRVCDVSGHFVGKVLEVREDCFVVSVDSLCLTWDIVFTVEGDRVNLICDGLAIKRYALP